MQRSDAWEGQVLCSSALILITDEGPDHVHVRHVHRVPAQCPRLWKEPRYARWEDHRMESQGTNHAMPAFQSAGTHPNRLWEDLK